MNQVVKQNKKLINSNKLSEAKKYESKLSKYADVSEKVDFELPSLSSYINRENELSVEIGDFKATLKQKHQLSLSFSRSTTGINELMDEFREIATIPTNYKPLLGIACEGESDVWILGRNNTITCYDIHGTLKKKVMTAFLFGPDGISVTRERELIYCDRNSGTVKIVGDGKSETLITPPIDWKPRALCCTSFGDTLVHVYKGKRSKTKNKIIRYRGQGIEQEIDNDEERNPVFKDGDSSLYVAENINGDICVSDNNSDTVVVLNKAGIVQFRYDGKPAGRKKSFDPRYIATDALGLIIVSDFNNDCLHIMDRKGQFLRCVDNCGLEKPCGLSVNNQGKLYVGLHDLGEIKVIEYLKHT